MYFKYIITFPVLPSYEVQSYHHMMYEYRVAHNIKLPKQWLPSFLLFLIYPDIGYMMEPPAWVFFLPKAPPCLLGAATHTAVIMSGCQA